MVLEEAGHGVARPCRWDGPTDPIFLGRRLWHRTTCSSLVANLASLVNVWLAFSVCSCLPDDARFGWEANRS